MQHAVVEGEPGIFPAPVARVLRAIGGLFDRGRGRDQPDQPTPSAEEGEDAGAAWPTESSEPTRAPQPPESSASSEPPSTTRSDEPSAE